MIILLIRNVIHLLLILRKKYDISLLAISPDGFYNGVVRDEFLESLNTMPTYKEDLLSFTHQTSIYKYVMVGQVHDPMLVKAQEAFEKEFGHKLSSFFSSERFVDDVSAQSNKKNILRFVEKQFGIKPEEVMYFGDALNDKELLLASGVGVVMENGFDVLKNPDYGLHSTSKHTEGGVGKFLTRGLRLMIYEAEAFFEAIESFEPFDALEEADRESFLYFYLRTPSALWGVRENLAGHLSASAWIISEDRQEVLLGHHNLYDAWGMVGRPC